MELTEWDPSCYEQTTRDNGEGRGLELLRALLAAMLSLFKAPDCPTRPIKIGTGEERGAQEENESSCLITSMERKIMGSAGLKAQVLVEWSSAAAARLA